MLADEIREFAFKKFIEPARKQSKKTVQIRAGNIHKMIGLSHRMPAVSGALGSEKFEKQYNIKRIKLEGPIQGSNTLFTFEI